MKFEIPSSNDQQFAIEHGHRNSEFTMIYPLKMVDLSIAMLVCQRVCEIL